MIKNLFYLVYVLNVYAMTDEMYYQSMYINCLMVNHKYYDNNEFDYNYRIFKENIIHCEYYCKQYECINKVKC
jgi:hypothetical protein